jgi:hypothetical protein
MGKEDEEEKEEEEAGEAEKLGRLEEYYFKQARKGIVMTVEDMQDYCLKNDITPCPPRKELRRMRFKFKYAGLHARWKKPPKYVGSSIDNLGNIFVDIAEFGKDYRVVNANRHILLVGVDLLSQRIEVIAYPNKTQESWADGIGQFILKKFPCVRTIVTDRDTAISHPDFQKMVYDKYGVDWIHLRSRSKSYAAERAIRTIKTRLSQAMSMNDKGDNRWLVHLPGIVADLNNKYVRNTKMRRKDVTKENVMQLLAQIFKVKDFTPILNTKVLSSFSPQMYKAVGFKFDAGSKVQVSRNANYNVKLDAFTKKSVEGNYSKKVYTVEYGFLKSSNDHYLCQMYKVRGLKGIFYSTELIPALFTEPEDAPDEDALDKKKKIARAKRKRDRE